MSKIPEESLACWTRWPAALEEVLNASGSCSDRAVALARLLRDLVPAATLTACRLDEALAIQPESSAQVPRWRDQLAQMEARGPAPMDFSLADETSKPLQGLAVPIHCRGGCRGMVCLALAAESPAPVLAAFRALLCMAAHGLARALETEALSRDQREWVDLLAPSEALIGLIHEMNNSFNTMMLQAAVIEMKARESLGEEAKLIRREGAKAAARLVPFQQIREQRRQVRVRVDLNQLLLEVTADYRDRGRVNLDPASGPLLLSANPIALKQMVHLLLQIQRINEPTAGLPVLVRTQSRDGRAYLFVGHTTSSPDDPSSVDLLDPQHKEFEGIKPIEHLALLSLARLLEAGVKASTGPEGSLSLSLSWNAAQ